MNSTLIIAEAGVNHNGSLEQAIRMIEEASKTGVDIVKFQTFHSAARVISQRAPKADYQIKNTGSQESQLEMIQKLHLDKKAHKILIEECKKNNVEFLSTPFDLESVDFLLGDLGLKRIKIPSGELTNAPLLLKAARYKPELIVSTGMSDLSEVKSALSVLAYGFLTPPQKEERPHLKDFEKSLQSKEGEEFIKNKITLLHCTTEYPAPLEETNLRAMDTLQKTFGCRIGLSDHTLGIAAPLAAVARGACVIEKHFTLDRNLPGPDHVASLEILELKEMVKGIRLIETLLGDGKKQVTLSEQKNLKIARKSLIADQPIKKGEPFTTHNLTLKRPGNGMSPFLYWELLGKKATRDYLEDDLIQEG